VKNELVLIIFKGMKRYFFIASLIVFFSCANKDKKNDLLSDVSINRDVVSMSKSIDSLEVYDFNGLKKFFNKQDDKVHVINFWATWCGPCVKELPYFEVLREKYKGNNIDFVLVSLDFPHLYESKLKPFLLNKKLKSKVVALDDVDSNTWIPQVDESWSGAIPATVIYKKDKRKFFEKSFTLEELDFEIKQFLN
jgi:thiol-disulfide isomerase/thioredoxin